MRMRSPSPCASTCTMCVLWYPGWGEASLSQGMLLLPPPPRGGVSPWARGPWGSLVWFAVAWVVYLGLICLKGTTVKVCTDIQCCFGEFIPKEFWLKIHGVLFFFSENLKQKICKLKCPRLITKQQ